jgi:hypothetical protein
MARNMAIHGKNFNNLDLQLSINFNKQLEVWTCFGGDSRYETYRVGFGIWTFEGYE